MANTYRGMVWLQNSEASYYDPREKKWFYGHLKLATTALLFMEKNKAEARLYIDFKDIKCINLAMSSMIFPAITVKAKNDTTHWLSSFQDRNSTFLVITHFFEAFSSKTSKSDLMNESLSSPSQRSKLGTALLQSVQDSDATLRAAAADLAEQGEQLSGISTTLQDIQEDLNVAERITSGLDSWLGRWRIPKAVRSDELILFKDNEIPDVLDVEVLYRQILSSKVGPQTPGVCRVASAGISILNMKQKVIQHFQWSQVSCVRAVSPWEVKVTQYLIGQPDLSFNIVSVHMDRILAKLARLVPSKLKYDDPPPELVGGDSHGRGLFDEVSQGVTSPHRGCFNSQPADQINHSPNPDNCSHRYSDQHQAQVEQPLTDLEVAELSTALSNIRATALAVGVEQDKQADLIDDLTSSVTMANDRVRAVNRTMDKLLK